MIVLDEISIDDWENAMLHFLSVREGYEELQAANEDLTVVALRLVFDPLQARYDAGERTAELYEQLLAVE